jgi:hypothetical protein
MIPATTTITTGGVVANDDLSSPSTLEQHVSIGE